MWVAHTYVLWDGTYQGIDWIEHGTKSLLYYTARVLYVHTHTLEPTTQS